MSNLVSSEFVAHSQYHEEKMRLKGGIHSFETEVLCADSVRREFLFSIASVNNDNSLEIGTIGVMLDLTEQNRRVQKRLRKEKPQGIIETTSAARREINQPLQMILEYSKLLLAAPPKHVFISYVRENLKQVDRLCQDLERNGVNVWLDRKSIKPGARWKDAICEAIRHGDFFIACFSNDYTSKGRTHMNEELVLATEELRKYPPGREWFIPVLLSECDVPARSIGAGDTLLDINWVPLYEDWETGIQRILSVIKPIPPKIQNLIYALRTEDRDVRDQAIEALRKIGAPSALPALIETLKDEDKYARRDAAKALMKIGPEARAAVPELIEALKDEDYAVRRWASQALEGINTPEALKAFGEYRMKFK